MPLTDLPLQFPLGKLSGEQRERQDRERKNRGRVRCRERERKERDATFLREQRIECVVIQTWNMEEATWEHGDLLEMRKGVDWHA